MLVLRIAALGAHVCVGNQTDVRERLKEAARTTGPRQAKHRIARLRIHIVNRAAPWTNEAFQFHISGAGRGN
jgi:hypothetical protein